MEVAARLGKPCLLKSLAVVETWRQMKCRAFTDLPDARILDPRKWRIEKGKRLSLQQQPGVGQRSWSHL